MADGNGIQVLVVDDEPLARERLSRLCASIEGQSYNVVECASGDACLQYCAQNSVDVVLLDIEMPGLNGLKTARQLQAMASSPAIIFCTAYNDFALEAFDAEAIDYLLKPVALERLRAALDKSSLLQAAKRQRNLPETVDCLWATTAKGKHRVRVAEVRALHAENKYVAAKTKEGDFLLDESLKQLELRLGSEFLRVHRATLINTHYLEACERASNGDYLARLQGVSFQPKISRRLLPKVQAWIKQQSS